MTKSVLSIQSYVSHGYVGGKAAIFPLQTQGWEVDSINTVDFSNHTGYGFVKGSTMSENGLSELLQGLADISQSYDAVLSGYIPNDKLIRIVGDYVKQEKTKKTSLIYLLDPVMGDEGHIYVDKSCIKEYKRILEEGIVDVMTPNQFEVELLCGFEIKNITTLKEALSIMYDKYKVKYIIVTSLSPTIQIDSETNDEQLACAVSTSESDKIRIFKIPLIKSYFTGVGDLFSALLLDKMYQNLHSPKTKDWNNLSIISLSVNQVLTVIMKTLKLTHSLGVQKFKSSNISNAQKITLEGEINNKDTMKFFELKIIQSRDYFSYAEEGIFSSSII